MLEDWILNPPKRFPWIKVAAIGTIVTGGVGGGIGLVTSNIVSAKHELAWAKKEISLLEERKTVIKEKDEKIRKLSKCHKTVMEGNIGCWRDWKKEEEEEKANSGQATK